MHVMDDGSLATRPPFVAFNSFHSTIGSSQSPTIPNDWGKYNEPLTLGASPTITTTITSKWVEIDFDAPHGLVTGNWINGISELTTGNVGGVPYTEFNNSQWRCVKRISDNVLAIRTSTAATSTASIAVISPIRYCNKVMLMLPQGVNQNEQSLGLVDGWYFNGSIIIVDRVGVVYAVNGAGEITIIYNDIIAEVETGAPRGWRPMADSGTLINLVTAVPFKGTLAIHNGLDKPLEVYNNSGSPACRYLVDAGENNNTYVPIGNLCTINNQYHCVAGQPLNPSAVSISAKATNGTFLGAAAPNDAIELFVDEYSESGDATITGIGTYRGRLLIFTSNSVLVFALGQYVSDTHTPQYIETIYDFGTRSPRSLAKLNDDLLVIDEAGLSAVKQARISTALEINRYSDVIRDHILRLLENETTQSLYSDVFSRIDRKNRMLITRLDRSNPNKFANISVVVDFFSDSSIVAIRYQEETLLREGDTITLYDFSDQANVSLSGGADRYKQYTIRSVSEDMLSIFFDCGQEATATEPYETVSGFSAEIISSGREDSFVRENKDAILGFRMITGSKINAWQELAGLNVFGQLRSAITTELNNIFLLYDSHMLVMANRTILARNDGTNYLGQNMHSTALLDVADNRWYHAGRPVFDPLTASEPAAPPQHALVTSPTTLAEDLVELNETWSPFAGNPIKYSYTSPWIDFGNRRNQKSNKFIALDTEGTGIIRVQMFADGIIKDDQGNYAPVAEMSFWAGDKKHHLNQAFFTDELSMILGVSIINPATVITDGLSTDVPVNALASNQLLHPFDAHFRTMAFRIYGDTTFGRVRIVGVSFFLSQGTILGA